MFPGLGLGLCRQFPIMAQTAQRSNETPFLAVDEPRHEGSRQQDRRQDEQGDESLMGCTSPDCSSVLLDTMHGDG